MVVPPPLMLCAMMPLDLLVRLSGLVGDDDQGEPTRSGRRLDARALFRPRAGGHFFWIPSWLSGPLIGLTMVVGDASLRAA